MKTMSLDTTRKTTPFAGANYINTLAFFKHIDFDFLPLLYIEVAITHTEFA